MNINIKSAEAHRLAVELARKTGDSITGAVTKAIKAELRRHENNEEKLARIHQRAGLAAGRRHGLDRGVVVGPVGAAFQGARVQPGLGQHRRGGAGVAWLAAV